METEFKKGDCVQLKHGVGPEMSISELYTITNEAQCTWFDPKKSRFEIQTLSLNVLKSCSPKPSAEDKLKLMQEIFPPRNL